MQKGVCKCVCFRSRYKKNFGLSLGGDRPPRPPPVDPPLEVAGSNLGRGYFAPRSTQPSIPTGSVNEYQLRLGRQRQVWLIPIGGVQVRLWNPLRKLTIPERFCGAWWFTTKRRYTKCRPMHLLFGFSLEKSLC